MSLRRYLVFGWDRYEASGGWHDFIYSYDDLDEAKQLLIKSPTHTHEQQAISAGKIVLSSDLEPEGT